MAMNEITAGDLWERRSKLEDEAASLLGHMLFEFSRLEVNLALCLVWVDGGRNLESLTKSVESQNFKTKLDELSKYLDARLLRGSKGHSAYESWIQRAHVARQQRNNLVHGRWGVEALKNCVVNVIGLPTSETQQVIEYSIEELAAINSELRHLQSELRRMREHWPL
ncbi:hypothetical protein CBM2623_A280009 [Cupriavidus taiwanensis]|nr:hypothetical protein CBM2608_A290009 [Cupriavidus taiwanensis]SPA28383.1 hypothetical protein CBM2623_A280009 [Cupriavidus taiwanensis]